MYKSSSAFFIRIGYQAGCVTSVSYTVQSSLTHKLQTTLPDFVRQRDLALPAGRNPEALRLSGEWRQRHAADAAAIVQEALRLFHEHAFYYTLTPPPLGANEVDDFLFRTHQGFCEHYAAAFTVLMRAAGIPARIVTGYLGGYWNELGQYLLVRQSDAHAWSEVWLEGRGWVRIDPTAAVRPDRIMLGAAVVAGDALTWTQRGWLAALRNNFDLVKRWWGQSVIGFSAAKQRQLFVPWGIPDADTGLLIVGLAGTMAIFILAGLAWALWRRRDEEPATLILRQLERKLFRCGVVRQRGEGPADYLQRAIQCLPAQISRLQPLMTHYLELRYAHPEPPAELLHAFRREVRDFRRHLCSNKQ